MIRAAMSEKALWTHLILLGAIGVVSDMIRSHSLMMSVFLPIFFSCAEVRFGGRTFCLAAGSVVLYRLLAVWEVRTQGSCFGPGLVVRVFVALALSLR